MCGRSSKDGTQADKHQGDLVIILRPVDQHVRMLHDLGVVRVAVALCTLMMITPTGTTCLLPSRQASPQSRGRKMRDTKRRDEGSPALHRMSTSANIYQLSVPTSMLKGLNPR